MHTIPNRPAAAPPYIERNLERMGWALVALKDGAAVAFEFLKNLIPEFRPDSNPAEAAQWWDDPRLDAPKRELATAGHVALVRIGVEMTFRKCVQADEVKDFSGRLGVMMEDAHGDVDAAGRAWNVAPEVLHCYLMGVLSPTFAWVSAVAHQEGVSLDWLAFGTCSSEQRTTDH